MKRILRRLRSRANVGKLRERARVDPYPRSYVELCKLLLSHGDMSRAMEVAREGLERFPHSEDLRDVLRHTWRQTKADEIDELRRRCVEDGDENLFQDLVRIYLECEEYDEALAAAEELSRRDPDGELGMLLQGEVLLRRFYKDHVASDARRAIVLLQRVIEISERSFTANYLLAQVYHYIGAISKALFHLYRALDVDPDNEKVRRLYDTLIKLPLEKDEENTLLREIEESEASRFAAGAAGGAMSKERRAELMADLTRLSTLNGVTRAAFVSPELTIVASRGDCRVVADGHDGDPLCDIARGFRKAAAVSSKRMGIGAFQSSVLDAGRHMLQFHAVAQTVILVESDDLGRRDVIRAECMNFVASCLRTAEGLVHA